MTADREDLAGLQQLVGFGDRRVVDLDLALADEFQHVPAG